MSMLIRKMKLEDSQQVAVIHTRSWQHAYKGILDQNFLDSIDVQKREVNWRKGFETNAPSLIRLVLEVDNEVIAFACGLDNRTKKEIPNCDGELWAIYVHPDRIKRGAGKMLLKEFVTELRRTEKKGFCVWVLEDNSSARMFYESQGGILSKAIKEIQIGGQTLVEVAYEFDI